MPNEVQTDRLDRWLRRLLGMSTGMVAPTVGWELQPTVVVEGDRFENELLKGSRHYAACCGIGAGGAGAWNRIVLWNNSPATHIVVVHAIVVYGTTATTVVEGWLDWAPFAGYLAAVAPNIRDGRQNPAEQSVAWLQQNNTFALGLATPSVRMVAPQNVSVLLPVPWVLYSGSGLVLSTNAANQSLYASFLWSERNIETLERRLA